ncbi:MAG: radical SAM protein [Candidatus Peregrinibacteria bacterium]|nr:radical SAM protein [Candidatus Peregrinibacteria bacterium]
MKKALIRTGYSCNNNCTFCHLGHKRQGNLTTQEIKNKIIFCKKKGYNFIVLSGGEPTIRKDLLIIANFIKQNEMSLGLITNGRMFSYKPILEKLIHNNLKYAYISLLGSTKEIHDKIVGAQSFNQTIKGIENLTKHNSVKHKINVTVVSKNINDLKNIVDLAKKIGIKKLKFSSVDYKGNVLRNIKMVPKLSLTIDKIKEAIDYAIEKDIKPYISDLPLCLIGEYNKYIDNMETNDIEVMSEIFENELFYIDSEDKTKPTSCAGCTKYKKCKGIDKEYLKINGDKELKEAKNFNRN